MDDKKSREIERLERKLSNEKESHTANVFLLLLVIGIAVLAFLTGGDGWGFFIGAWVVVAVAWIVAKNFKS